MMSDRYISFLSRPAVLLASVGMIVVAGTGCGASQTPVDREVINTEARPSSTAPPGVDPALEDSPTPPKAEIARDRAMVAYRGMWKDVLAAGRTSDADSPRLDDHATGDALAEASRLLRANRSQGLVAEGKIDQEPFAKTEYGEPKVVLITDCVNDLKWQTYQADTGEPVDGDRGRHGVKAFVRIQSDMTWKVSHFWMDEVGTC